MEITDAITEVKRAQNARRKAERERDEINDLAKRQRVENRRLKRLLQQAVALIPSTVRADKLFEQIDGAIHSEDT